MPKVLKIKTDIRVRTRILPDRKVKKTRKFDIVGELLTHYGEITGENVTRQIFSYLDFSSFQQGRLVCKIWNRFLMTDQLLSLYMVMRTEPYLEKMLIKVSDEKTWISTYSKEISDKIKKFVKKYFEYVKNHQNNLKYQQMFQLFKKIQNTIAICHLHCDYEIDGSMGHLVEANFFRKIEEEVEKGNDRFCRWWKDFIVHMNLCKIGIARINDQLDQVPTLKVEFLYEFQHDIQVIEKGIQRILEKVILGRLKREFYSDLEKFKPDTYLLQANGP